MKNKALILVMAILLFPRPGWTEDADTLIDKGIRQYESGYFKAALSTFKSALALDPENPTLYWYLANAAEMSEAWADAVLYYNGLLNSAQYVNLEQQEVDEIKAKLPKFERAIYRSAKLSVTVVPKEAQIQVDGVLLGTEKISLTVSAELEHGLLAEVQDYETVEEFIQLEPGEDRIVRLHMKKIVYEGTVEFVVSPNDNVKIFVDGNLAGTSITELRLPVGWRLFCFEREGFGRWWRFLEMRRGERETLRVILREDPNTAGESCEDQPSMQPPGWDPLKGL